MAPTVIAFGPDGSFFIQSPSMSRWQGLPERIENDIQSGEIVSVIHMVMGTGGSYFVSYKNKKGGNTFYSHGLPKGLESYIMTKDKKGFAVMNISKMRLTLGPDNASSFVLDGHNFRGHNLPEGLSTALAKLRNSKGQYTICPRIVELGPNGEYVMINERNGASWNTANERLSQHLKSDSTRCMMQDVRLSTHNPGCFLTLTSNGVQSLTDWIMPTNMKPTMEQADTEIEAASAAAAITRANQQANSDFMLRQMLQAQQFNNQMALTTMQNITAMNGVSMINSAIF